MGGAAAMKKTEGLLLMPAQQCSDVKHCIDFVTLVLAVFPRPLSLDCSALFCTHVCAS